MATRRENFKEKVLRRIKENPGTTAEDIKVAYRATYPLAELEREGKIYYQGGAWYAKEET